MRLPWSIFLSTEITATESGLPPNGLQQNLRKPLVIEECSGTLQQAHGVTPVFTYQDSELSSLGCQWDWF